MKDNVADIQFHWRGVDAEGRDREGEVSAPDRTAAARLLIRQGITPVALDEVSARQRPASVGKLAAGPVTLAERLEIVRELGTLLSAGISMAEALPSLSAAYASRPVGPAMERVNRAVRGGERLSVALRESGLDLAPYVVALVEAGEASGALGSALMDSAVQMEHDLAARREIKNALVYPAVLVSAGTIAVVTIFVGVVPRFAPLLRNARAEVPAISRWTIETGIALQQHWLWVLVVLIGVVALGAALLQQAPLRAALLEAVARMPVVGSWIRRTDLGRWAQLLGSLLANRVPIVRALELSKAAMRLPASQAQLTTVAQDIQRGKALADALTACEWFPSIRLNLVRVGERSGELPRLLKTLGDMETQDARALQARVLTLIEPMAILLIGAVIGFVMVAVMMAVTSLNTGVA